MTLLPLNQEQFHARAGENAVVSQTAPRKKRKLAAKPSLKAITWSDLKLHRNRASQYPTQLSSKVTPPVLCKGEGQGFCLPKPSIMVS